MKRSAFNFTESRNLIEVLTPNEVAEILQQITEQYRDDKKSMKDWLSKYDEAIKLAKMKSDLEAKDRPFKNASKVMSHFLMQAAIQWNARFTMDVIASGTPIKTTSIGKNSDEKEELQERISEYSNLRLRESEWFDETDKEALSLPIIGTTFKKIYWDGVKGTFCSWFIPANKVVFNHEEICFDDARQIVHDDLSFTSSEVYSHVAYGDWQVEESLMPEKSSDEWKGYEAYCWLDLDDDGIAEPYTVLYIKDIDAVVQIAPRYSLDDIYTNDKGEIFSIKARNYLQIKIFIPDPEGGCMGMGWGIMLSDTFKTINTNLRQLIDAGTLSNNAGNSGLLAASLGRTFDEASRMQEGDIELEIGKIKRVQVSSGASLRESFVQLPFKGADVVLLQLMQWMEEKARELTMASDVLEARPNEAASLYLARLQQAMKSPNTIMVRVYRSLKREFETIVSLIAAHEDGARYLELYGTNLQSDFNSRSIEFGVAADPAQGSDLERLARQNMILEMSAMPTAQGLYNNYQVHKHVLDDINYPNTEAVLPDPTQQPPSPPDPMVQAQMQIQAEMIAIQKEEVNNRRQKVALDQLKIALEAKREAEKLRQEGQLNESKIAVNIATALEKLENSSSRSATDMMLMLEKAQQTISEKDSVDAKPKQPAVPARPVLPPAGIPTGSSPMAGVGGNEGVPQGNPVGIQPFGGRPR